MTHNKLYRNFIILQEDENNHSNSDEKPLSGYAKIEAKSDKCKISFYAQNLKKSENYTIVLICYKKEVKQIIDLGKLEVNEVGKGEAIKEYYINDIAGLNLSYEKISGAAICKHKNEQLSFLMYGFMNNENIKEDWKKAKIVKCFDKDKPVEYKKLVKEEAKSKDDCKQEDSKKENKDKKDHKHDDMKECKDNHDDKKDYKQDECKVEHHDDKIHKDNKKEEDCKDNHDHHKDDKNKYDKICDEECKRAEKSTEDGEAEVEVEVDKSVTQEDFADYEESINNLRTDQNIDPYDFRLRGAVGEFFNNIVKGFEEVKGKFKEIKYCKWYKIKISGIDDMCNTADYNKYTVAYYPMLNYYPYIKKYGYFFIGYKCDPKGNLKYIVYGIPGNKNKDEQPYVGKTGFVTWVGSDDGKVGCWLMFYDYKNSNIVVPMK